MQRPIPFALDDHSLAELTAALKTWEQLQTQPGWRLTGLDRATQGGLPVGRLLVTSPNLIQRELPFSLLDPRTVSAYQGALDELGRLGASGWQACAVTVEAGRGMIHLAQPEAGAPTAGATRRTPAGRRLTPQRRARSDRAGERLVTGYRQRRPSAYDLSDRAALAALRQGEGAEAAALRALLGDAHFATLRQMAQEAAGKRGARRTRERPPKALVLPGIMGSKLGREKSLLGFKYNDVIWLDPVDVGLGRLEELALSPGGKSRPGIGAVGVLYSFYLRLKLALDLAGFDADFYAYDWRRGLKDLGAEFAAFLAGQPQPVYIVGHSMGGMVTRAALKQLPDGGRQQVARVVMLGTPNHGSFVPVQALRAAYPFLKGIGWVAPGTLDQLTERVFAGFPGLYDLLAAPALSPDFPLYTPEQWPTSGPAFRRDLLERAQKSQEALAPADDRFHLVAGVDQDTVVGVRVRDNEFVFLLSKDGDGTVPRRSAELPGCASTHYVRGSHGFLPNLGQVCNLAVDLARDGQTNLETVAWVPSAEPPREVPEAELRGAPAPVRGLRRQFEPDPEVWREILSPLLALEEPQAAPESAAAVLPTPATARESLAPQNILFSRTRQRRLEVTLVPGSLTDVSSRAYVLGLFHGVAPAGAAAAVDRCMNFVITDFVQRRMFSGNLGEVFILPKGRSFVAADHVIFVGLGPFDRFKQTQDAKLHELEAMRSVAQSVIRTCLHANIEEFATVLLGASAAPSTAEAMRLFTQSFVQALEATDPERRLRRVILCETNPTRAQEMREEIVRLGTGELFDTIDLQFQVLPPPPTPEPERALPGQPLRRVGGAPTPIYLLARRVDLEPDKPRPGGQAKTDAGDTGPMVRFETSILTPESRAAVLTRERLIRKADLDALLQMTSRRTFSLADLERLGSALGEQVFGAEVVAKVEDLAARWRTRNNQELPLVVVHDRPASALPWETLRFGQWVPARVAGLSRHQLEANLSVAKWLEQRREDPTLDVLLVTNPTEDLDGADGEGDLIRKLLSGLRDVRVVERRHEQATVARLREDFSSGQFDVIHYAGHAYFNAEHPGRSGVYCHGGEVLSGSDLASLSDLPALVFFNACESGRIRGVEALLDPERRTGKVKAIEDLKKKLTATRDGRRTVSDDNISLANAFIRGGVANFLGTYWPVGDLSALTFSQTFYPKLVEGASVGDAVLAARQAVAAEQSVDWVDYLLYGSPEFVLKRKVAPA